MLNHPELNSIIATYAFARILQEFKRDQGLEDMLEFVDRYVSIFKETPLSLDVDGALKIKKADLENKS